jgi:hypothetical protein
VGCVCVIERMSTDRAHGKHARTHARTLVRQGMDPKELKKQRRLIRNRVASQLHRERQRAHLDGLQAQLKEKVRA